MLSCPVLSCPVLSCPTKFCHVLSCHGGTKTDRRVTLRTVRMLNGMTKSKCDNDTTKYIYKYKCMYTYIYISSCQRQKPATVPNPSLKTSTCFGHPWNMFSCLDETLLFKHGKFGKLNREKKSMFCYVVTENIRMEPQCLK